MRKLCYVGALCTLALRAVFIIILPMFRNQCLELTNIVKSCTIYCIIYLHRPLFKFGQMYASQYVSEISLLLQRLPREVLLLLKTNDCLRAVDHCLV